MLASVFVQFCCATFWLAIVFDFCTEFRRSRIWNPLFSVAEVVKQLSKRTAVKTMFSGSALQKNHKFSYLDSLSDTNPPTVLAKTRFWLRHNFHKQPEIHLWPIARIANEKIISRLTDIKLWRIDVC